MVSLLGTNTVIAEDKMPEDAEAFREPTVEEIIVDYSIEKGVDPDLALRIAKCESGLNPLAKNPNSSAGGVFQFIDGTWNTYCEGDKFNAKDNITCAIDLLADGGISHWRADPASPACWDK